MTGLDDLKHSIRTEWVKLDHAVIAAAVHQWRRRLSVSAKAGARRRSFRALFYALDIVFSAITTTFLTVADQSNSCLQIATPVWFNCSCQFNSVMATV